MAGIRPSKVFGVMTAGGLICTALGVASAHTDDDGAHAAPSKVLTICAIPGSMPRMDKTSDSKPIGLDVAVIERLGKILGRPIEFHWCASAQCAMELPAGGSL